MATLHVGTYTQPEDHVNGHGEGIYSFNLNEETFESTPGYVLRGIPNPSFLAIHPNGSRLYAVSETTDRHGKLYAIALEKEPRILNSKSTHGAAPCYVSVDENFALVANYLSQSAVVLPIRTDGKLSSVSDTIFHEGTSAHPSRQQQSHPHSIVLDPARNHAIVADLGTDRVVSYEIKREPGRLIPKRSPLQVHAGAGPRHLTFHTSGRFAYIMNELDSTIIVCRYNQGQLTSIQTVEALPRSFSGNPSGADIHIHPSGRFLYASLRGINNIIRMRVDPTSGRLSGKAYAHVLGITPRNFALDPKGRYLVVANQDSDTLVILSINQRTGLLSLTGEPIPVPSPACVVIGR